MRKTIRGKKEPDNTQLFLDNHINIDNRIIHIFDEIDQEMASNVIKGVQLMMAKDGEKPIDVYINSFGGCVYSSFAIYDFLRTQTVEIRTHNIGCAMSGGSIIYLAGDVRYAYKNSVFMLHTVSDAIPYAKAFEITNNAENNKAIIKQMCDIYGERTNRDAQEWKKIIKYEDKYYRSEEALKLNIVTEIVEYCKVTRH